MLSRTPLIVAAVLALASSACGDDARARGAAERLASRAASASPTEPVAIPLERSVRERVLAQRAVTVRVALPDGGAGSGTLVTTAGHVLTAGHVVEGASEVRVTLPDGTVHAAHTRARDPRHDLALLELEGGAPTACVPRSASPVEAGAWVVLAGFVGASERPLTPHVSVGPAILTSALTVETPSGTRDLEDVLLTSAHVAPGMSGGPAIDGEGQLVGVVAALGGRVATLAHTTILEGLPACDAAAVPLAISSTVRDPQHDEPDRDASLRASADLAAPSARMSDGPRHPSGVEITILGVALRGVVVAPGVVLTLADAHLVAEDTALDRLPVPSHPGARVTELLGVSGPLALLGVEGIDAAPVAVGPEPALGALLEAAESAELGVVSETSAVPGRVRPYVPNERTELASPGLRRCGTLLARRRAAAPIVELAMPTLAHDVRAARGELLLDAHGSPVAIHVTSAVDGVGYAVTLERALASFEPPQAR